MKSALTTVLITFLTLETVQTSSDNYKKVGDTVVLSPGSVDAPITSITWKHNSNLTVEWYGDEIDFYPKFKDRCTLNTTTGELTISGLTLEDSGSYTAEINNRVMNTTEITVISVVPPPTVSTACDHEMTYCVLTCDVNTTDPEPLTYYWILDGRALWYEEKSLNLTKEESSMHLISCAVENPISSESSKEVLNPFITSSNYKKVGDTVVLSPDSVSAPITSITWKHNSKFAVIWTGDEIDCSSKFKGRCKLNTTTGELTISGLTLEDSGSYTAEINNRVLNPTKINVISEVPTPTVSESCDAEKTHCVLTCEGITTDAEPVVYSWWSGDVMKSKTKELNITKEEKSSFFRCTMINPVSTKRSKQVVNPVLNSNTDNPDFYKKVGDTVVLSPNSIAPITSITWKHGSTVAVKWDGDESVSYGDFKGHCKLKTTTGELTISNLTLKDSGSYTVEINGDAIKTTKIKVISAVPTPTISTSFNELETYCVLTCEVNNTTDSEPVTYTWWSGDVMKSETKELRITKEEKETSFICKVENPVSSEGSKEVVNPFITSS